MTTNISIRQAPPHLIILNRKESTVFIALKHDKAVNHIDTTGFFSPPDLSLEDIRLKYSELVPDTIENRSGQIVEMSFPWHQVQSIQNLGYRHKGTK